MPLVEYRGGLHAKQWATTRWAARQRDRLIEQLGGRCRKCNGARKLTFDHINPIGWDPSVKSWHMRMREYVRAHEAGNLQILCVRCHGKKSRVDQVRLAETVPF